MNFAALSDESTMSTPPLTFGWLATIPTGWPSRRAKPTMTSWAKRRLISNHEPAVRLRHVAEVSPGQLERVLVGLRQHVAAPGDLAVHARAAQLLQRRLLADRHL